MPPPSAPAVVVGAVAAVAVSGVYAGGLTAAAARRTGLGSWLAGGAGGSTVERTPEGAWSVLGVLRVGVLVVTVRWRTVATGPADAMAGAAVARAGPGSSVSAVSRVRAASKAGAPSSLVIA